MSTVVIAASIIVTVTVVAAVLFTGRGRASGGHRLKRRFGPEYARAVARHDGNIKEAERELDERVQRHGALKKQPLPPGAREQYVVLWARIQEWFVDSPWEAAAGADVVLARLAKERGFPGGEEFEEQLAALSVHHAGQVHGYRRVHMAVHGRAGTEEMREAVVEARDLFDELLTQRPDDSGRRQPQSSEDRHHAPRGLAGVTRRDRGT
ncbi:hypothetical protein [Streptomyces hiroshimensis]|uniref:Secreted protein n=1 Tax=Streptomyces hiroshimensis TaxID=66424 RepID=A0ABQ2YK90_9ACTN|nr:hypothetical protein [Streptomyces hiroshimensis]GGX87034.1 hypothetical protein GCM10010324_35670 [Streptomyces hiroshimensis]